MKFNITFSLLFNGVLIIPKGIKKLGLYILDASNSIVHAWVASLTLLQ